VANATPSRPGAANLVTGTYSQDTANFLKLFSGETLAAYQKATMMMGLHKVRRITQGKSAQFMHSGRLAAQRHMPGTQLLGTNKLAYAETTISVDYPLTADTFIADWDEAISHFDVRSEHTRQLGDALAQTVDQTLLRLAALGGRVATGAITTEPGGSQIVDAAIRDTKANISKAFFTAAQIFAEKNVPTADRHSILNPMQYYLLAQDTTNMNKDWGGVGNYSQAQVPVVAGINVHVSNNVPGILYNGAGQVASDDDGLISETYTVAAATGEVNAYNGTFTNTLGVIFQKEALATVQLWDVTIKTQEDITRGGTIAVAKMLTGHGILRPECCIELAKA